MAIWDNYPNLRSQPQVDWQRVSPVLLNILQSVAERTRKTITITSGYRSPGYNRRVGGVEGSRHQYGLAVDATVDGRPIAHVIPASVLAHYGLRSGDQPNFYRGERDPVHVDLEPSTLWGQRLVTQIVQEANQEAVDPVAVLAVASTEGSWLGDVGDSGTSFGPFQLRRGGALPSGRGGSWANTPAGVDYALQRIGDVAAGLRGEQAITAIVTKFERPADPGSQIAKATARYRAAVSSKQGTNPRYWTGVSGPTGTLGGAQGVAFGLPGPNPILPLPGEPEFEGPKDILGQFGIILWPFTHPLRAGQIVAGSILAFAGVILLAKSVGAPAPVIKLPGVIQ